MPEVWNLIRKHAREATFSETTVTVTGSRLVTVENVTNVYECNEIMVRLKSKDGDIVIWGEDLRVSSFKEGIVRVSGVITSVELIKKVGAKDD